MNWLWKKFTEPEGRLTGPQTFYWFVFVATVFFVLQPNANRYRFSFDHLNGWYQALVYMIPAVLVFVLCRGSNFKHRKVLLFMVYLLASGSVLFAWYTLLTTWNLREKIDTTIDFLDFKALVVSSPFDQTFFEFIEDRNYVDLVFERAVLNGLLLERKVLMEVSPAHNGKVVLIGGKILRFTCTKAIEQTYFAETYSYEDSKVVDISRDFDGEWNGPRNSQRIILDEVVRLDPKQ